MMVVVLTIGMAHEARGAIQIGADKVLGVVAIRLVRGERVFGWWEIGGQARAFALGSGLATVGRTVHAEATP